MIKFSVTVTGKSPLLMHNGRLAIPTDRSTRELAEAHRAYQKDKTDANFEAMQRAEFMGSLYYFEQGEQVVGPYWPTDNFHTCLKNAGAKRKRGRGSLRNPVGAGLLWDGEINPLAYAPIGTNGAPAPRSLDELWKNGNYHLTKPARVGSAKVARTRPIFRNWRFKVTGALDEEILDFADLEAVLTIAGQVVGLGDWRPETKGGSYGRFEAALENLGAYEPAGAL